MNKEKYIAPVMEIIEFETEDVITTSGLINEGIGNPPKSDFNDFFNE